jgi:hypothetical protein
MSFLDRALPLARMGFRVFPLKPRTKLPAIRAYSQLATRDEDTIRYWASLWPDANVGISTNGLWALDLDAKPGKRGDLEIYRFCDSLPETYSQITPNGEHHVFQDPSPCRNTVGLIAPGIDTRGEGGFIVGAGSVTDKGEYRWTGQPHVALAPRWLVDQLRCIVLPVEPTREPVAPPDLEAASKYLQTLAPLAVEGAGGDATTYRVASHVRDLGLDQADCLKAMLDWWNDRCSPPWTPDDLAVKVGNAYRYAQNAQGSANPEAEFKPIESPAESDPDPVDQMNRQYAYALVGNNGCVLWETTDHEGRFDLRHLHPETLHTYLGRIKNGSGKAKALSEKWLNSPKRRTYDGVVFAPGKTVEKRFYNLWQGFAYEPLAPGEKPSRDADLALGAFIEHLNIGVCNSDDTLAKWLTGYFAHMIQKSWEKPLVSLMFRGNKGTGKDAIVDRVGALLGQHYLSTAKRRYLFSNFNSHLENLLFFVLNEAFHCYDRQIDGTLKDLVTGRTHVIERKGQEPYPVANLLRIAVVGNEDVLGKVTWDERRWAAFTVNNTRRRDKPFFKSMRVRMEEGGYRLLMRYLLEFDLTDIDLDEAPNTETLHEAKMLNLDIVHEWWHCCLLEGRIVGADFSADWPEAFEKDALRAALRRWKREREIQAREPHDQLIGKRLQECCPKIDAGKKVKSESGRYVYAYVLPGLDAARVAWGKFIGREVVW